jgi:hypothetical protein
MGARCAFVERMVMTRHRMGTDDSDPACLIGTNFHGAPPPEADLGLHFSQVARWMWRSPPGSYTVEWINARHPADRRDGGVTADGQGLAAPRDGGASIEDWLVYLRSRDVRVR